MPRISQAEQMLMGALGDLEKDWNIAGAAWHDKARRNFETDFLEELQVAGRQGANAIQELSVLMRRVVRECS